MFAKWAFVGFGILFVSACATQQPATSRKSSEYTGKIKKVALVYVDNRTATSSSSSGSGFYASRVQRGVTSAQNQMALSMQQSLPGLVSASGIDQTFTRLESRDVTPSLMASGYRAKLPPDAIAGRMIMMIVPRSISVRCGSSVCYSNYTLSTDLVDSDQIKTVWTSQVTIRSDEISLDYYSAGSISKYWQETYRALKADGLVN